MPAALDSSGAVLSIVLLVVVAVLGAWTISLHSRLRRTERELDDLFGDATSETLPAMLAEYLTTVRSTAAAVERMRREHEALSRLMPSVVRHVGLVRFSPFHDTGGDQSFALALLDGRHDGIVITGLHSRNDSRLYAKPVERGDSPYSLTPEEREAMHLALRQSEQTALQ